MRFWKRFSQSLKREDRISGEQLLKLFSHRSEEAWDVFLKDYTDVMFVAIQSGYKNNGIIPDDDLIEETYADVLERLRADNYRKLRSYQGKSTLRTWLTSVCRNACIDSLRKDAPPEIPVAIQRLSEVHQAFFKLRYVQGGEERECWRLLGNLGFQLSGREFDDVVASVESNLTHGTRGRFTNWRNREPISIDGSPTEDALDAIPPPIVADERTPDLELINQEDRAGLKQIIQAIEACKLSLSSPEQLIVNLIYWKKMKPHQIAGLMRLSAKEVSRKNGVALQKLKQCVLSRLQQQGYTPQESSEIANRIEELYRETDSGE